MTIKSGVAILRSSRKAGNPKRSNKLVGFVIVVIMVALVFIFNAGSNQIKARNEEQAAKIEKLQQEIESEKKRAEELDEYARYVNTKQFVEDMARKKLGLLYPDEKVFKSGN